MREPLLIEIGCEEIPARMIGAAAEDLRQRLTAVLDQAGIEYGPSAAWGGARRLAVRIGDVQGTLPGKDQLVLGPPATAAFRDDGTPTPAGAGFAKKQGIDPGALRKIETEKGLYAGFHRAVAERTLADVLAAALPPTIAAMTFPKTMRWGAGTFRFVRPVHWVVALHGAGVVELEVLGAASGRASDGHRFLAPGPVAIDHVDRYVESLRAAHVLVDPVDRRAALTSALDAAARAVGGTVVPDDALLDEVIDLVEWPGVVAGRFDRSFLELPQEILVTTLKHHQKSFSVRGQDGLLPAFLSVANTDRDPAGHVRRGNEWVVVGRLDDARFFWDEDRKRPLASRVDDLKRVTFHKKLGSYEDKTRRVIVLADAIAKRLGASIVDPSIVAEAARMAKADLVTGLVGEFPELQGVVGGLLLRAEGAPVDVATAVAEHYKPAGADDSVPASPAGCVVSVADRLDTISGLIRAGETPTGSRDPFGLRRAASGVFRILAEREWPISMTALLEWTGQDNAGYAFLQDRFNNWLMERGFASNEIWAVRRPKVSPVDFDQWSVPEILSRLGIVATLRGRADFAKLVELTKRVDNILEKQPEVLEPAHARDERVVHREGHASALGLEQAHDTLLPKVLAASSTNDFARVIDHLGGLVAPVAKFFDDVLVLDPANPAATRWRCELLAKVRTTVTRDFDIRELAGQADSNR
jgi:glycyl-tRNA synthetase beta chain